MDAVREFNEKVETIQMEMLGDGRELGPDGELVWPEVDDVGPIEDIDEHFGRLHMVVKAQASNPEIAYIFRALRIPPLKCLCERKIAAALAGLVEINAGEVSVEVVV